ncbi:hypothetical protein EG346_07000 [Chryseobacterium carnipullorum]|uniref:Uncharacterized protein n=2 Tax=Chryseobacterium carnipullorum TaxID=1124835 RepID=A0A3G6LXA6_CHRCU|nr:hypothetical protein [Chryseobacterium carnipullorum]AZA47954.1 hypothetical protein EG346_07000 [Chryseobacterium carnipullorum]AZA67269.1 hypothetical protein EG345_23170 [Chryseobacterium carnipullorum]
MSKFLPQKKKLLEDVYEKASNEATETSFNGILLHLEQILKDDFEPLSYKSFENYYKAIVEQDEDYNIKRSVLDNLSRYLGFDTFQHYCSEWRTVEYSIQQAISKIVITIINKPILEMPQFMKQNGLGIMEIVLLLCLVTGNVVFSNNKKISNGSSFPSSFMSGLQAATDKKYMYWDGERYIATDSSFIKPGLEVKAMNEHMFLHFRKIKRKDTLTDANALGRTWYSKFYGNVEFFTDDGVDPENGRELRKSTSTIIYKYAGKPKDSVEVEE